MKKTIIFVFIFISYIITCNVTYAGPGVSTAKAAREKKMNSSVPMFGNMTSFHVNRPG